MASQSKDDLARALAAMSSQSQEPEQAQEETVQGQAMDLPAGHVMHDPIALKRKVQRAPDPEHAVVAEEPAEAVHRSASPDAAIAQEGNPANAEVPTPRPAAIGGSAKVRPAAPDAAAEQAKPAAKAPPAIPAAPAIPSASAAPKATSPVVSKALKAPAAGITKSYTAMQKASQFQNRVQFKQTIIPPLLTMGVILSVMGIASMVMGEESPLGESMALPVIMLVLSVLLLASAVLTMLQVRHMSRIAAA